jgi:uncharacterized protein (DUF2249 family)
MTKTQFDLRGMTRGWDTQILSAFDGLSEGQELEILLDRYPGHLQALFLSDRAGQFQWEILEKGPKTWKIRLLRRSHGLGNSTEKVKIEPGPRPAWVESLNPSCALFLDIRPLTAKGLDPFQMVIRSTTELKPGQHLHLLLNDQPEIFSCALGRMGYEGFSEIKNGTWNAYFRKGKVSFPGPCVVELDVRGLEPPLPLLKVLESLPSVSEGGGLKVFYPNRPDSLADKLRTHGFEVEWEEAEGASYVLQVWKK